MRVTSQFPARGLLRTALAIVVLLAAATALGPASRAGPWIARGLLVAALSVPVVLLCRGRRRGLRGQEIGRAHV